MDNEDDDESDDDDNDGEVVEESNVADKLKTSSPSATQSFTGSTRRRNGRGEIVQLEQKKVEKMVKKATADD